ncbi:hypothetical protein GEMRC1_006747 [Eukaryota sp. GEM-RC1]
MSLTGKHISRVKNQEPGLGIKRVELCSSFLAIGGYNERLVLLNSLNWKPVTSLVHISPVTSANVTVYEEFFGIPDDTVDHGAHVSSVERSFFKISPIPFKVLSTPPDPSKHNPRIGVGIVKFSSDEKLVATRNDNMTNSIWIWGLTGLSLVSLLSFKSSVKSFCWSPVESKLFIVTGTNTLYSWDLEGAACVNIPLADILPTFVTFNKQGNQLLLSDREKFSICYIGMEDSE